MIKYLEDLLKGEQVEWKTLGEVATIFGGLTGKCKSDFERGNARYVTYKNIFANNEVDFEQLEFVRVGENEKQNRLRYGDVLFTGSSENLEEVAMSSVVTTHFEGEVYLNSFSFGLRFTDEIAILPEFSKHLFRGNTMRKALAKTASGVTRFNVSKVRLKKIAIPIPPLHAQEKIVEILDKFTELQTELQTELHGRIKQYAYYREQLLSLEGVSGVVWHTMEEVFDMRNGYTPSKKNTEFWKGGTIPWFRMEDLRANSGLLSDSIQKITPQAVKKSGLFPKNSIIMATTATIGEHALLIADSLANQRFTNFSIRKSLVSLLNPKFVYYYFFIVDAWCKENVFASSFPSVDMASLKRQPFPIPPLAEQARIVSILDKFDALTTSLTEGLPREIALRQKQYAYYREQLLDFA